MKHNKLIYMDNKIINASYKVTLNELRLILLAISQINQMEKLTENRVITITASQYSSWFGGNKDEVYRDMKEALDLLSERWIKVIYNSDIKTEIPWITLKSQISSNQSVELRFTEEIAFFLSDLKCGFTKYELLNVSGMKSVFSIRLYQMLMQWKSKGTVTITVENLRFNLQITSKGYATFGNIKQKIIEPALNEINRCSDIDARYDLIKKGKTVNAIIFIFEFKNTLNSKTHNQINALEMIANIKNSLKEGIKK